MSVGRERVRSRLRDLSLFDVIRRKEEIIEHRDDSDRSGRCAIEISSHDA
jgi:hypothetical protein